MIAYAGLRAARKARDLYAKLLAAGITSVILIQATVNFFAVLGRAAADRRAAAVHLLREQQPDRAARGMGILINVAQRGARRERLEGQAADASDTLRRSGVRGETRSERRSGQEANGRYKEARRCASGSTEGCRGS